MRIVNSKLAIAVVLVVVLISTMACALSNIQFNGNSTRVTVKLKEDQVNDLLANSTDTDDPLLDKITEIDMHEDAIRVHGTYEQPNGSTAEGSYDVAVSTEQGRLKAQITDIDIEGVELGDPRIQDLNEKIASELEKSYDPSNGEIQFESIKITDDAMTIVVNTNWNDK